MTDKTSDYSNNQKLRVKQFFLALLYFPFQLVIFLCIYPFAAVVMACWRSTVCAFEDTYINEESKRRHWWITRFIGLDAFFDD